MNKLILKVILIVLLLADISYSFVQHYSMPLDGDMAPGILMKGGIDKIMSDPFALKVLLHNESYPNPNRFFAHWSFSNYFKTIPFLFQKFSSPISSVYLSCALAKTFIQVLIIYLLALCICGNKNPFDSKLLIAAAIITPLFQTLGYSGYMGVVNHSITYTFFYTIPIGLLLLFFYPFYNAAIHQQKFKLNPINILFLIILILILSFSCQLIAGIVIIACPLYFFYIMYSNHKRYPEKTFLQKLKHSFKFIPRANLIFFVLFILISIYSFFIGLNNSIGYLNTISIPERYARLPLGIFYAYTGKIGPPLLLFIILLNCFLIFKKLKNEEGKKILNIIKWLSIFMVIYIALLPLGGYKPTRPYIIKSDTLLPVTLCLIFIFGLSAYTLIINLKEKIKYFYWSVIIICLSIFTLADSPDFNRNSCERDALTKMANSNEKIILIKSDCPIMEWKKIVDYKESETNAEMIQYWNITKTRVLYSQGEDNK